MLLVATSMNRNSVLALKPWIYDNFMPGVNNASCNMHIHKQHAIASETKNYNNNNSKNNNNHN